MHYSLKASIFISLIFFTVGCSFTGPKVNILKNYFETDKAIIETEIPEFKNLNDKNFENIINSEYNKLINQWVEEFSENCPQDTSEKCQFSLKQEIKISSSEIISVVGEAYMFTDGIHGAYQRIAKNIDNKKNIELKLSDLFLDDKYPDAINREIEKILSVKSEEYHDLWEKPILSSMHEELFYITKDSLVIFYPPYELSYYARGFVEFSIPLKNLSGYLKPEYS